MLRSGGGGVSGYWTGSYKVVDATKVEEGEEAISEEKGREEKF